MVKSKAPDATPHRPFNRTMLTTVGAILGIASGSFGMWLAIQDRAHKNQVEFEDRITKQVRRDMVIDNRLTRLEERYEALKATVWSKTSESSK